MKKLFLVLTVLSLVFVSCVSGKLINSDTTVDAKVGNAVSKTELKNLERANERARKIIEFQNNKITYGFTLLDELSLSIAFEKQQAFNEGYEAGKKDAEAAMEGYIKIEDVEEFLRKKGLLTE